MRLIDADKLYQKAVDEESQALDEFHNIMNDRDMHQWITWSAVLVERSAFKFDVADAPTVDAVPVIRCKDCKYFTRDSITGVTIPGTEYCIFTMNNRIEENDFCSRAERRYDNENG